MELKSLNEAQVFNGDRFTKRILFQNGDSLVFVLNFMPGQQLPTHKHPGTHVYLTALSGEGTVTVNGQDQLLRLGEVLQLEGDEDLAYRNSGNEPSSIYVWLCKVPAPEYAQPLG